MPWVAVDSDDGLPWPVPPPMAALNRARRHRLYPGAPGTSARLRPGGYQWYQFHAHCPDARQLQLVHALYICTSAPVRQGDGFVMQKFYFSAAGTFQWLHLRAAESASAWRFSDFVFHMHYA